MRTIYKALLLFSTSIFMLSAESSGQLIYRPVKLETEYLANPIGIDAKKPRFSWQMADTRKGAAQTAYRVLVGTDSAALLKEQEIIWNTGWIQSSSSLINYTGQLKPYTKYYWCVAIADQQQKKSTSAIASFETGLMEMRNWKGSWISDVSDIKLKPAPYFRKTFSAQKHIKSARAYIAAAGLYELSINGKKVGNHRMDPMYTRFDRRTLYVTYDVTDNLKDGTNAIGVLLGNGWYNHQSTAVWDFHKANWRARPTFCLDLRITYEDGSVETITSGKGWKTALSPVIFNSIYTAEHYDAR
jgi:alpha-L-rhamnosidase